MTTIMPSWGLFGTLAEGVRENSYDVRKLSPGDRVGHYRIIGLLGQGGASTVYQAKHVYLEHEVALKSLIAGQQCSDIIAQRFLREARVLVQMDHPSVLRVYDAGIWERIPFIVVEQARGDLSTVLTEHDRLSVERALDMLEEIVPALIRQEELGIVHRDIKPANIMQREGGGYCLGDYGSVNPPPRLGDANAMFGDMELTLDGSIIGTPAYMSPEQAVGQPADHRSDLYGLGMTAWQCLTGTNPRKLGGGADMFQAIREIPIPDLKSVRPDVPEGVDQMVRAMVAHSPADRYQSARDLFGDLKQLRYGDGKATGAILGSAFVAMPYARRFGRVFKAIESACHISHLRSRRMDQLVFIEDIWRRIVLEMESCHVVVADFSGVLMRRHPNANVITEAAHARAIGKPLIIITQDPPERLPFDWRQMPVIRYRQTAAGLDAMAKELAVKLHHVIRPQGR